MPLKDSSLPLSFAPFSSTEPFFCEDEVTLVERENSRPCLFNICMSDLHVCVSMPGSSWSTSSITVTFEPSLDHTLPSSNPTAPAPITIRLSGTASKERASSELTMFFPSNGTVGSEAGALPAAMITLVPFSDDSFPSLFEIFTSCGEASRAVPWKVSILFSRMRRATPLVSLSTACLFLSMMAARSNRRLSKVIPWVPALSLIAVQSSVVSSSALAGMQPTFRQVPPRDAFFSMIAVRKPSWDARMAAVYPPGPAPITMTSNVRFSCMGPPFI